MRAINKTSRNYERSFLEYVSAFVLATLAFGAAVEPKFASSADLTDYS